MNKILFFTFCLFVIITSCSDNTPLEPEKEFTDVNELIKYAGKFENSNFTNTRISNGTTKEFTNEGDLEYSSESKNFIAQNSFDELVLFNNNFADILYPGSLIQGEKLKFAELNPLGDFPRNNITLTLSGGSSIEVPNPSKASVNDAIKNNLLNNIPSISNIDYTFKEMFSFEQSLNELGVDANWLVGSIKTKFNEKKSKSKKSILLYFKQVYYSISSNSFPTGKDFFKSDVDIKSLQTKIKPGNPPCYISQVNYGRIILVKVTSTDSFEEMVTNIEGSYLNISGNAKFENNENMSDYEYTATVIGGSNIGATEAIVSQDIESINNLIKKESNPSKLNPGAPISFIIRSLYDNSVVRLGSKAEFTIPDWKLNNEKYDYINLDLKNFHVIDDGTIFGSGKFTYEIVLKDKNGKAIIDEDGNELFLKTYSPQAVSSGNYLEIENGDFKRIPIEKNNSKIFFDIKVFYHNDVSQGQLAARTDNTNSVLSYPPSSFGDYNILLKTVFSDFEIKFNFAITRN